MVTVSAYILYINTRIWHLERWYWWTYLQGSNANADIREQTCGHSGGRRGGDKLREEHGDIYMRASGNLLCAKGAQLCDKGEGWSGGFRKEGTYVCLWLIHADAWQKPTQYVKQLSSYKRRKKKDKPKLLEKDIDACINTAVIPNHLPYTKIQRSPPLHNP